MNKPVKYIAELSHVREVSLLGTADLAFWNNRLKKENFFPFVSADKAQIFIIAADSKFMGVNFREVSISVLVSRQEDGSQQDGAYLLRAFNSCRLFAFAERALFSTPYDFGDVRVSASFPASIQLVKRRELIFRAEMEAGNSTLKRKPSRHGEGGWEGPVFLPGSSRVFFAKIRGATRAYPYLDSLDLMTIKPSRDGGVFQSLIKSQFVGKEWSIREDATHAKSKTYRTSEIL